MTDLFDSRTKKQIAIERLRHFEREALAMHPDGYYLAFSGGKDSQTIYHLAKEAGVRFTAHFNWTTVDPPEVLRFIRENYPDVIRERPPLSMFQLIVKKRMPPTRIARYCCEQLKERGGTGRFVITGIRWQESSRRSKRQLTETCRTNRSKRYLHPIIDWTTDEVWKYLDSMGVSHCSLYDEGFSRIGCVGCPMARRGMQLREFARWPNFERAYRRAFRECIERRHRDGLPTDQWTTGDEIFDWWIGNEQTDGDDELGLFEP